MALADVEVEHPVRIDEVVEAHGDVAGGLCAVAGIVIGRAYGPGEKT